MKLLWGLMILAFSIDHHSYGVSARPNVVNIGSILTFDSVIGKVAKIAIEAAVEDVNSNPDILKETKLNITMRDSHFSGFLGIMEAIYFMQTENVAIIGPQSPVATRALSYLANELHVPLLSFSVSDPTMSSLQFPYFVRTSLNDLFQMAAIADIVKNYGWRDVIAVFVDDDYGRNGISALADQLAAKSCQISYKAPLKPESDINDIRQVLIQVALQGPRVIVVHTYPERGLDIMAMAQYLKMMEEGYVWIATSWLSTVLDTDAPLSSDSSTSIQGVVSIRVYTPDTEAKRNLVSSWSSLIAKEATDNRHIGLSSYALYAYDTVWMLARAINVFLDNGGNISFSSDPKLKGSQKGALRLDKMSIFSGGKLLLDSILKVNMSGVTGPFKFTSDRNLVGPAFEIINVVGNGFRRLGYWSNSSGLSVSPPGKNSSSQRRLYPAIWPGETSVKPRGWVFPNNGRHLRIGVPIRVSFQDFVGRVAGNSMFTGYCMDVFAAAINLLPYAVPYELIPYGDGRNNPSCTELIRLITSGVYDAAIGDIAIITDRTRMADFTQPYIESGLVVVAPIRKLPSSAWAFFRPFSSEMWCVTGIFFLLGGIVIWAMEHRINDDFRGPPRKQVVTVLCCKKLLVDLFQECHMSHVVLIQKDGFSDFMTYAEEKTISAIGRLVLVLWLFAIFIIKSSYTASLTSILTAQQLSSPIKGIESLQKSDDPIGYQQGSFSRDYLIQQLGIQESRLVPLKLPEDYAKALNDGPKHGGVAAVVDERAYAELFLSTRCEFSIVGREFTKNGWGFAFPKDSPLTFDISTAILKLSENGELQRIHDKWLLKSACSSQGAKLQVNRLSLTSFEGMFFICLLACIVSLIVYLIKTIHQFNQLNSELENSNQSSRSGRLQTFFSFADEKEESVKARSIRRQTESGSSTSMEQNVPQVLAGN